MSLLLLASMPAASPDGPSDAEEAGRLWGLPEGMGDTCPQHCIELASMVTSS